MTSSQAPSGRRSTAIFVVEPGSPVTTWWMQSQSGARRHFDRRVVAGLRAGADRQRRDVLVEFERAGRRGVAVLQVVPRPALAQPPPSNAVASPTTLPSMRLMPAALSAAAHSSKTAAARLSRLLIVGSPVPRTIRSPFEDAVVDVGGGLERRLEPIVPAERFRRGRQRHDLHVRRRHHQLAGVERVEDAAGVERFHLDAPEPLVHDRRAEDAVRDPRPARARRGSSAWVWWSAERACNSAQPGGLPRHTSHGCARRSQRKKTTKKSLWSS